MNPRAVYEALISGIPDGITVQEVICGSLWTMVRASNGGIGLAMTTKRCEVENGARGFAGLSLRCAAQSVMSWNFIEAGIGLAAINAFYNTPARMRAIGARKNDGAFCTKGIFTAGMKVTLVGALKHPQDTFSGAESVKTLERENLSGTYPDSAAEFFLPESDLAVITGSAFINKTMPRLLELCGSAKAIITGPSTPLAECILGFGASRLAGLVITDAEGCRAMVCEGYKSAPYRFGEEYFLGA